MSIGDNIKKLRKEKDLTQIELSKKAQISRSYLADVEKDRYNASVETLKSIAAALECSISDLMDNSSDFKKDNDPDIRRIERARSKMPPKDKEKMMRILEASFDDYFD